MSLFPRFFRGLSAVFRVLLKNMYPMGTLIGYYRTFGGALEEYYSSVLIDGANNLGLAVSYGCQVFSRVESGFLPAR